MSSQQCVTMTMMLKMVWMCPLVPVYVLLQLIRDSDCNCVTLSVPVPVSTVCNVLSLWENNRSLVSAQWGTCTLPITTHSSFIDHFKLHNLVYLIQISLDKTGIDNPREWFGVVRFLTVFCKGYRSCEWCHRTAPPIH